MYYTKFRRTAHHKSLHYIILNNGILKSNSSIFPRSKGAYGLIVNENNEVSISLMIVKMFYLISIQGLQAKGYIWQYIPCLVLIWIQYTAQNPNSTTSASTDLQNVVICIQLIFEWMLTLHIVLKPQRTSQRKRMQKLAFE